MWLPFKLIYTFLKVHTKISNAKLNNQNVCLYSKACVMTWHNRILKIIQKEYINGKMFLLLSNFLNNRTIQVKALSKISNISYPIARKRSPTKISHKYHNIFKSNKLYFLQNNKSYKTHYTS